MQRFRFRLARVLEYQRTRLGMEEHALERLTAERRELEAERERAAGARLHSARALARETDIGGLDLQCLDAYARRMERRQQTIQGSIKDCERREELQRAVLTEARRRVRLLEKLRDRRLADWNAAFNRELQELASEFAVLQSSRRGKSLPLGR